MKMTIDPLYGQQTVTVCCCFCFTFNANVFKEIYFHNRTTMSEVEINSDKQTEHFGEDCSFVCLFDDTFYTLWSSS